MDFSWSYVKIGWKMTNGLPLFLALHSNYFEIYNHASVKVCLCLVLFNIRNGKSTKYVLCTLYSGIQAFILEMTQGGQNKVS